MFQSFVWRLRMLTYDFRIEVPWCCLFYLVPLFAILVEQFSFKVFSTSQDVTNGTSRILVGLYEL
jgi:hypothetical protein